MRSTTCIGAVSKTSPIFAQASRNPDRTSVAPSPPKAPLRALSLASTLLHPARFEVGGKSLGFVDGDVGLQRDRWHQVVDDVTLDHPVGAPVVRETDGVNPPPLEVVDRDAVGDEHLAVDLAAARRDSHPVGVVYPLLFGQLGADLGEEFGLQFGEPGNPTTHRSAGMVLGEPVGRDYVREAR